jgi:DNA-binding MarR family transcriptional regulator
MVDSDAFAELARVIATLNRRLDADIAAPLAEEGVPHEWLRVLEALSAADGAPMQQLADAALMNPTTLTKTIDRMIARALVYRAPDAQDRRRVLIFLTGQGRGLAAQLRAVSEARVRRLSERLDREQATALARALRALI